MMSLEAKSFRDHFPYSHAKGMVTLSQKLDLLKQIAHGLAVQFGSSCEIVIHDLRKKELDSSIAVSYTHLDVYKRQHMDRSSCSCRTHCTYSLYG